MSERAASIDPSVAAGWLAAIDRSQFMLELEPDGTIVRVNALLCAALGYDEAELVGRRHRNLIVPGTRANASAGEPHRTIAYRARDGRQVVVRASVIPIVGADNRPARSLVIGIDVSDRGDLRAALAENGLGVAGPGGSGLGATDAEPGALVALVLAGRTDPASRLDARIPRQARIVSDLLDGANARSAGNDDDSPTLVAIAIADLVCACANAMRPAAEDKGLVLRCEVDPDLPHHLECDGQRLRAVLLRLIENAVRSTEEGWISICAEPAWDDPGALAISVTDTGIGMEVGNLEAAQGDPAGHVRDAAAPVAGQSSGLTISAEAARQMGGTLTHSSERGRGTRAELRVPLRPAGSASLRPVGSFSLPD